MNCSNKVAIEVFTFTLNCSGTLQSSSIIVRESFSISAEVSTTVAGLKANDTFSSVSV